MSEQEKTEFTVSKHSYSKKTCSDCKGEGKGKREFRKMKFVYTCQTCKGSGKETVKTTEQVSLAEALEEIQSIKP